MVQNMRVLEASGVTGRHLCFVVIRNHIQISVLDCLSFCFRKDVGKTEESCFAS